MMTSLDLHKVQKEMIYWWKNTSIEKKLELSQRYYKTDAYEHLTDLERIYCYLYAINESPLEKTFLTSSRSVKLSFPPTFKADNFSFIIEELSDSLPKGFELEEEKFEDHLLFLARHLQLKKITTFLWQAPMGSEFYCTRFGFILATEKNYTSYKEQLYELPG